MAAKKTPETKPATEKKTRAPKPVTDLATATTALKAAQRRADRAEKAYDEARAERDAAQDTLTDAKATVKRFYAELMGEQVDEDTTGEPEFRELDPVDEYEGAGHNAE